MKYKLGKYSIVEQTVSTLASVRKLCTEFYVCIGTMGTRATEQSKTQQAQMCWLQKKKPVGKKVIKY